MLPGELDAAVTLADDATVGRVAHALLAGYLAAAERLVTT